LIGIGLTFLGHPYPEKRRLSFWISAQRYDTFA